MKRRLKTAWLHTKQVLPHWLFIVICLIAFFKVRSTHGKIETAPFMLSRAVILFYVAVYGMWRAAAFFPRGRYRLWLIRTPWTWQKPLPFGPLMPVWQDGLFIILLTLFYNWDNPLNQPIFFLNPVLFFLLGMIVGSLSLLSERGQNVIGIGAMLGLAAVAYFWPYKYLILALALIIYTLTSWGIYRCLRGLDTWDPHAKYMKFSEGHYPLLLGQNLDNRKFAHGAMGAAITVAVWVAVIVFMFRRLPAQIRDVVNEGAPVSALTAFIGFYSVTILITFAAYFGAYLKGKQPPINLIMRLYTTQWIIPGYDRIRLPAIAALIVGALVPIVLIRAGLGLTITYAISLPLSTLCYLMAPTYRNWELTGHYRVMLPKPEPKTEEAAKTIRARRDVRSIRRTLFRVYPKIETGVVLVLLIIFFVAGFVNRGFGAAGTAIVLFLTGFLWGFYRIDNLHPAFHPDYTKWLMRTPWHPAEKLPFGPVGLVWQDFLIVAVAGCFIFMNVFFHARPNHENLAVSIAATIAMAVLLIASYSLSALMVLYGLGQKKTELLMLIVVGGFIWLFGSPFSPRTNVVLGGIIFLILPIIASVGLQRSLRGFPWSDEILAGRIQMLTLAHLNRDIDGAINNVQDDRLFYEYRGVGPLNQYLSPKMDIVRGTDTATHLFISLFLGWFAYLFAVRSAGTQGHGRDLCVVIYTGFIAILTLARMIQYWSGTQRPISIMGRLLNGIWFDWRRDKPFVISMALFVFALVLPLVLERAGVPLALNMGVSVFVSRTLIAFVGPDVRSWRLTGAHRAPKW